VAWSPQWLLSLMITSHSARSGTLRWRLRRLDMLDPQALLVRRRSSTWAFTLPLTAGIVSASSRSSWMVERSSADGEVGLWVPCARMRSHDVRPRAAMNPLKYDCRCLSGRGESGRGGGLWSSAHCTLASFTWPCANVEAPASTWRLCDTA